MCPAGRPCDHRMTCTCRPSIASPVPAGPVGRGRLRRARSRSRLDVSVVRLAVLLLVPRRRYRRCAVRRAVAGVALPVEPGAAIPEGSHRLDDGAAVVAVVGTMLVLRDAGIWFGDAVAFVGAWPPSASYSCGAAPAGPSHDPKPVGGRAHRRRHRPRARWLRRFQRPDRRPAGAGPDHPRRGAHRGRYGAAVRAAAAPSRRPSSRPSVGPHPRRREGRDRRAPPRRRAADARSHPAPGRTEPGGRGAGPAAGARAARLAVRVTGRRGDDASRGRSA